jgi:hypothetical protein
MGNRQQTMAKMARERAVREKRERKAEKKRLKKLGETDEAGVSAEEGDVLVNLNDPNLPGAPSPLDDERGQT